MLLFFIDVFIFNLLIVIFCLTYLMLLKTVISYPFSASKGDSYSGVGWEGGLQNVCIIQVNFTISRRVILLWMAIIQGCNSGVHLIYSQRNNFNVITVSYMYSCLFYLKGSVWPCSFLPRWLQDPS